MRLSNVAFRGMVSPVSLAHGDLGAGRFTSVLLGIDPDILTRLDGGTADEQKQQRKVSHGSSCKGETILVPFGDLYKGLYKCQ